MYLVEIFRIRIVCIFQFQVGKLRIQFREFGKFVYFLYGFRFFFQCLYIVQSWFWWFKSEWKKCRDGNEVFFFSVLMGGRICFQFQFFYNQLNVSSYDSYVVVEISLMFQYFIVRGRFRQYLFSERVYVFVCFWFYR